jgi:hypothetical protein
MISMIHFPHDHRFAVRLRFLSKTKPETVEIAHDPNNDPPRKWVFHWRDGSSIPVHCELRFYGPDGNMMLDVIFQPNPIIILANKTGLIITTGGQ